MIPTVAANAILQGHRTQLSAMGVQIQYRQDGVSKTMPAVPGVTDHRQQDVMGLVVETHQSRDFRIAFVDFPFSEPKRGDRIVLDGEEFEVLPPIGEGRHWEHDPWKTVMRIHTKKVSVDIS